MSIVRRGVSDLSGFIDTFKAAGIKKWLLVLPIVFLIFLFWALNITNSSTQHLLLEEKRGERRQSTEFLQGMMDEFIRVNMHSDIYDRGDMLVHAIEFIEQNYHSTYAQVFNEDLEPLNSLHQGVQGGKKHNPLNYKEFVTAVNTKPYGDLTYYYETEEAGGRDVYITFRWINCGDSRYLVVMGVSKFSIITNISVLSNAVIWCMIIITSITMFIMIYAMLKHSVRVRRLQKAFIDEPESIKEAM